jgi:hypothetical protein
VLFDVLAGRVADEMQDPRKQTPGLSTKQKKKSRAQEDFFLDDALQFAI